MNKNKDKTIEMYVFTIYIYVMLRNSDHSVYR